MSAIGKQIRKLEEENERLREVLKAYEAWEADLILTGDWSASTVRLKQSHHDRLIEIQAMRNAALSTNSEGEAP